jgi:tetratricopeptide (TPR) repeat protein
VTAMPIFLLLLTLSTLQDPVTATTVFDEATRAARAGNFNALVPLFERAASAAEADKDVRLLARSLSGVGWAQWGAGQYEQAYITHERSLALFRQRQAAAGESLALLRLGETLFSRGGEYSRAIKAYLDAAAIRQKTGDKRGVAQVLDNLGNVYLDLGRALMYAGTPAVVVSLWDVSDQATAAPDGPLLRGASTIGRHRRIAARGTARGAHAVHASRALGAVHADR